ncbi:MAG: T9SS type A sorting domain-containing protein [Candidatus Hatepunaea meridiana]|nr:T9SS type A sorting domain-containing protein [Candidatus Hatepunaea meridiana]
MERTNFRIIIGVLIISLALFSTLTLAAIMNVPDDYEDIQEAIDWSRDSDTVLVQPGEYVENINFDGKDIVVLGNPADPSEVIIDGGGEDRVVTFDQGESSEALLSGFTIRNGSADRGGGILCSGSSPTLQNLIIRENEAGSRGGGLYRAGGDNFVLRDIVFEDNSAMTGGGIYAVGADIELFDVIIRRNTASQGAGGFEVYGGGDRVAMTNVLIAGNSGDPVGGVYLDSVLEALLTRISIVDNVGEGWSQGTRSRDIRTNISNSIFWGNQGNPISLGVPHGERGQITLNISYTDLQWGGIDIFGNVHVDIGDGMLDENPLFVDPEEGDYHLTADSPCIDAGDPDSPEDPDETRADMGAFYYNQEGVITEPGQKKFPSEFRLSNIYPNPFNSTTTIKYSLPMPSDVSLAVYDPLGRRVTTLFEGYRQTGFHSVNLNACDMPSGLYFVGLETSGQIIIRKVTSLK